MNKTANQKSKQGKALQRKALTFKYKPMLASFLILFIFILNGCTQDSVENEAVATKPPTATATTESTHKSNEPVSGVQFENIVQVPSQISKDFTAIVAVKPDHLVCEKIAQESGVYDLLSEPPYIVYSHPGDDNDRITILNLENKMRSEFISRTDLRRFIRHVSLNDTGYSYLTTAEHQPYIWQYRTCDIQGSEISVKTIDVEEILTKESKGELIYSSDIEEERDLLAWIEETKENGISIRNLYICQMSGDTLELIDTIRLNKGVDTLTPLILDNQTVSYVDWSPVAEKWYIRTYDIFKGEYSPDSHDFELDTNPVSPPMFDRSAVSWVEETDGSNSLYYYDIQKHEKYLVDTGIQSPKLHYPWLTYVKDGKLFGFDYHEMKKCILFDNAEEKVISGDMNYCLTEGVAGVSIYQVSLIPEMEPTPVMKYVTNDQGVRELERLSEFERTGMLNCKVTYNGLECPELYINFIGWPLENVCKVIGADIEIHESKNIEGADVPEKFTVSHGDTVLTFTGEAMLNSMADGGANYTCVEIPSLKAVYVKRHIEIDLPDLLDALHISWSADTTENVFHIGER